MEQVFGHFENLPRLKGPSWTIKDLEMEYASRHSKSLEPGGKSEHFSETKDFKTFCQNFVLILRKSDKDEYHFNILIHKTP